MDINSNLFEQIQQFVVSERGKYRFPLIFETSLEGDLKITGTDAVDFILAFGKKFNIDVSNFDAVAYFGGEGGFMHLPTPGKIPLTLGDLYNSILTGSMYETDSFRQIIHFVEDEKWGLTKPFVRETELYRHLKLRGDDAREFLDAFVKKFTLDASEFDFDKYFPKGDRFLSPILDFILRKKITLGDLERAVKSGKLV